MIHDIVSEINNFEEHLRKKYKCSISIKIDYKKRTLEYIKGTIDKIMRTSCEFDDISERNNNYKLVMFRAIYYDVCRRNNYKLEEMARFIGRDHSTALHSINRLNKKIRDNDRVYTKYYNRVLNDFI